MNITATLFIILSIIYRGVHLKNNLACFVLYYHDNFCRDPSVRLYTKVEVFSNFLSLYQSTNAQALVFFSAMHVVYYIWSA